MRARRLLLIGSLALSLGLTTTYLAKASTAVVSVRAGRPFAQFILPVASRAAAPTLDDATVRRAVAARPLDQALVNVAMVRDMLRRGRGRDGAGAWMAAITQMGWRDNSAQMNRLYAAADRNDLRGVLDVGDALLRRRQLSDQLVPVLMLTETDERARPLMIARLADRPMWRDSYLQSIATLTTPDRIAGRALTLDGLTQRGSTLSIEEARANAIAFDRGGRPDLGHALWSEVQPGVTVPLDDLRFARVARRTVEGPVAPYEWSLFNGEGFGAEAFVENGRSMLEIRWNGRGVPIFARQRTAAKPGFYKLVIDAPPETAAELVALTFRLICDGRVVTFRPASALRYVTDQPVPCGYPVFEVAGDLQAGTTPHQLVINGLRLDRRMNDASY